MTTETVRKILTRDFILVFFAQLTFIVVCHILIPTLPIYLSKLGVKETGIGVLIGSFAVSSLVFRPFVGRALLRIPEKRFMIFGALLFVLASPAYLVAPPFWPFLLVRIVQGIGLAFFNTAAFTLVAGISPEIHRGQSLSYFLLAQNVSLAFAPALGMLIINHFGFRFLFLFCLVMSLFSLVVSGKLAGRRIPPPRETPVEEDSLLNRNALPSSIVNFCFYFMWGAITAFFPLYAMHSGVANPGLFFTSLSIFLILSRGLGGRILDLYSKDRVIVYFFSLCIVSVTILAFSDSLPMFVLAGVIWGAGAGLFNPAIMAYALERSGPTRGPAMGIYTAFSDLGMSLGPVIMGIVISLTSYTTMFLCLGLMGVGNILYFCFFVRKTFPPRAETHDKRP
jgi:MFS family permease